MNGSWQPFFQFNLSLVPGEGCLILQNASAETGINNTPGLCNNPIRIFMSTDETIECPGCGLKLPDCHISQPIGSTPQASAWRRIMS